MGLLNIDRGTSARSDDLRTLREVFRTYGSHRSPQVIVTGISVIGVARLWVGGFGWAEPVVIGLTLLLTGLVEWFLHLFLLHAPEDSARMAKYGTGTGHREHHLDPSNIGWIMLAPQDAFVFLWMLAGWTAVWSLPLSVLIGASMLSTYLTALLTAYLTLAHYEWVHLLVHTRHRPKSRYYKRLEANHRLHHYRNEHYWLGVTSNLGDRILRTLPANKTDVPLSDTARSL